MSKLEVLNANFITFKSEIAGEVISQINFDILGGIDLVNIERMVCTLRVSFEGFPPVRSTLDLYNDNQTEKLQRTLCDKWELDLITVSKTIHELTMELEEYRLAQLKFTSKKLDEVFELSEADKKKTITLLKKKGLLEEVKKHLKGVGIVGEEENALILFLALTSHKFTNPFSVLCLAKSGIGKSYLLNKLTECMPPRSFTFHTQISANALYYMNSNEINGKALIIEDLEWTSEMLQPLATLQSQGRLVKTRATKDKDGMLHSTTFEVNGKLCLVACAYSEKNQERLSLPFLSVHLNHSNEQDLAIMKHQQAQSAGLINQNEVINSQTTLKNIIASLQNLRVINPFAPLIELPEDVAHPRKSLLLLLNFIEVVTLFHQHQRTQKVDETTGEVYLETEPEDIAIAFDLLKNNLFRRADELSTSARGFYKWLTKFLDKAKINKFSALDIRKARGIHPRTLNRYLQELKLFNYVQVTGGNKHREGFIYKLSGFGNQTNVKNKIEKGLNETLLTIHKTHEKNLEAVLVGQLDRANNPTEKQ